MDNQSFVVLSDDSRVRDDYDESLRRSLHLLDKALQQAAQLSEQIESELQERFRQHNERLRNELDKQLILMNLTLKTEFETRYRQLNVALGHIARVCEDVKARVSGNSPQATDDDGDGANRKVNHHPPRSRQ